MGKQIRFFMTFDDENRFLDAMGKGQTMAIILTSFPKKEDMVVEQLKPSKGLADSYYALVQSEQIKDVTPTFHPQAARFSVDVSNNNVLQFNRCYGKDGRLVSGRLWYEVENKPDTFVTWADQLIKWLKKNYIRDERGFYIGPDAQKQSGEGEIKLS